MKKLSSLINFSDSNKEISLYDNIYNDSYIFKFLEVNELDRQFFDENIKVFYDFYTLKNNYSIFNIKPLLRYRDDKVFIEYEESEEIIKYREESKLSNTVKTSYVSKSVLSAKFTNLEKNQNKQELAMNLIDKVNAYLKGESVSGVYIYGATGIGKTYLMGALYNLLKSKGKEPAIVFLPEFIRKVKSEINSGNYNNIIDNIREQEILIIDDIGSENLTDFTRDEILVPIINYRSDEKLLTFFTSNLGLSELTNFLATTKDTVDETKAARLLRRILDLAEFVKLEK